MNAVAVDWGTSNRRGYLIDESGVCIREHHDTQGMMASRGRFSAAHDEMIQALRASTAGVDANTPTLLSGMVGSANGWHDVPYLDTSVPLEQLHLHLAQPDSSRAIRIVPGYRYECDGRIDVMRGEETQLFGAVLGGCRDGWFIMPGTHCKWARLVDGRIERFNTFLTGELFELLLARGTLAAIDEQREHSSAAFQSGVRRAQVEPVTQGLFGCRAQVVGGTLSASHVASRVSGMLIGAEFAAMRNVLSADGGGVWLIGAESLMARYLRAAETLGVAAVALDARELYLTAAHQLCRQGVQSHRSP